MQYWRSGLKWHRFFLMSWIVLLDFSGNVFFLNIILGYHFAKNVWLGKLCLRSQLSLIVSGHMVVLNDFSVDDVMA